MRATTVRSITHLRAETMSNRVEHMMTERIDDAECYYLYRFYQNLTFRNRFDSTIFRCGRNTSASNVLNTNNIVDISRDNTYQRLSLYTDRISVESTSRIMLPRMSVMQFYRYYCMY